MFLLLHAGAYEDFFVAVNRNDGRAVAALLERGFDPNSRDPQGQVALILALHGENMAVAEALWPVPTRRLTWSMASGSRH